MTYFRRNGNTKKEKCAAGREFYDDAKQQRGKNQGARAAEEGDCAAALWFRNALQARGLSEEDAGTFVTITLVALAQLLTGLGVFDVIAKFAGAGVIVPITGFANSMVAPAIEYKKEGPVLGVGGKLFSVAGPVLVCGISAATLVGVLYWLFR